MICKYGCGKEATFQLKNGSWCCRRSPSGCEAIKLKNKEKQIETYRSGRRITGQQQYQNLPASTKEKMAWSKGKKLTPNTEIFNINSFYSTEVLKSRIKKDELLDYKCSECGIDTWQGQQITLDLDHVNGINSDNRLENLRFLCPNCHSLTHTYKGRNINTGRQKVSDQELLTAYKEQGNIRKALISVGLTPKGANYLRLNNLLART